MEQSRKVSVLLPKLTRVTGNAAEVLFFFTYSIDLLVSVVGCSVREAAVGLAVSWADKIDGLVEIASKQRSVISLMSAIVDSSRKSGSQAERCYSRTQRR